MDGVLSLNASRQPEAAVAKGLLLDGFLRPDLFAAKGLLMDGFPKAGAAEGLMLNGPQQLDLAAAKGLLMDCLQQLDTAQSGTIPLQTMSKFINVLMKCDAITRSAEIEETLKLFDASFNGNVDYARFCDWVMNAEGLISFCHVPYMPAINGSTIVHLKGFTSRLRMDSAAARAARSGVLEFLASMAPVEIIWDGDMYAEDSFTQLLPDVICACGGLQRVRLAAFLRCQDGRAFREVWQPLGLPVTVYVQEDSLDWSQLGIEALKCTQASVVACLGGGLVVKDEFDAAPANITFHLFPVQRPCKDGDGIEESSLLAREGAANLVVHRTS